VKQNASWRRPSPGFGRQLDDSGHLKDDKFIEAALAAKARYLLARDTDLTDLQKPFGVEILGLQFDTVRGVYQEGEPAFPGSGIRRRSHIQIAVRRPESVLGYFLPALDGRGEVGSFDS
jgi:hypothetical protein